MLRRQLALALLLLASAVPATWRNLRHANAPRFAMDAPATGGNAPFYLEEYLPASATKIVHSATVAELANGDLLAAWYGGSDEMSADVGIYVSTLDHATGHWSSPRVLINRARAERALGIRVKSIGNPVLLAGKDGVTMFFVSIPFGGWSLGTICMETSPDGENWRPARRVHTSPFLDLGMLVRSRAWRYDDGTIALPLYHALGRKWAALARLDPAGRVVDEVRIAPAGNLIQPWLVPLSPEKVVALLRSSSRMPGCLTLATSDAGGRRWSEPFGTRLVHRDSGVAGVRLTDGSLLVSWNNTAWDRRDLSLARSSDAGIHWSRPRPIERDTVEDLSIKHEYSYPYLYRTSDGRYHIFYTWRRVLIKHIVFNDAWVLADPILRETRR